MGQAAYSAAGAVDVAEVYSPPHICALVGAMGLQPGFSADITIRQRRMGFDQARVSRRALRAYQ
eukprot:9537396-Prorocentrum_lima.AAC.1